LTKIDELPNHRAYQLLQGGVQEMVMSGTLLSVLRTGRSCTPVALVLPLGAWLKAAQELYGSWIGWDVYTVSAIKHRLSYQRGRLARACARSETVLDASRRPGCGDNRPC